MLSVDGVARRLGSVRSASTGCLVSSFQDLVRAQGHASEKGSWALRA